MTDGPLRGVFPYLVSPIGDDGRVLDDVLARLIEHLIAAGVHGLTPLGSTGEFPYLTWDQKRRIVEVTMAAAAGRVPIVAGVAATTTDEACRQARAWAGLGVDGIVVMLEAYFPVAEDGVVGYFRAVAESIDRPVVLYTNPSFQRADLSLSAIARLASVRNILYIKDASTNTGRLLSIRDATDGRIGIFAASAHIPTAVMLIGGVGWMAGPACLIPAQSVALYELCAARRWDNAMALQTRLWPMHEVFQRYALAACVKGGLEMQGFAVGAPLAPQAPLSESGRADVGRALARAGVSFAGPGDGGGYAWQTD